MSGQAYTIFGWVPGRKKPWKNTVDGYTESIHGLSAAEKLALVERIWDDLAADPRPLPIPAWAAREAVRRPDEMIGNPAIGKTHDEA